MRSFRSHALTWLMLGFLWAGAPLQASYKFRGSTGTDTIALSTSALPRTLTVCLTVKSAFLNAGKTNVWFNVSGGGHFYDFLEYAGSSLIGGYDDTGFTGRAVFSGEPTSAVWNWICTTTDQPSKVQNLYINSNSVAATVTNGSDKTYDTTGQTKNIGYNTDRAVASDVDYYIGEVAIWSVVLDSTKLGHLLTDHYAASCYSTNLVSYWPLSANANDGVGGDNGTASGAALDGDHPTVDATCGSPPPPATSSRRMLMGVGK